MKTTAEQRSELRRADRLLHSDGWRLSSEFPETMTPREARLLIANHLTELLQDADALAEAERAIEILQQGR